MAKKKTKETIEKDKRSLYFILLMFPSLLLALITPIFSVDYFTWVALAVLIVLFQGLLIKNFLDEYYGY